MSIRTLTSEAFHVWAADRGIGRGPQDRPSERLVFTTGGFDRGWRYPAAASEVPHFVSTLLSAVRPNERYWMYPERGLWSPARDTESLPQSKVWMTTARALGVPAGLRGAVGFNSTDWNELCSMLFLQITLGPHIHTDASVIPETGHAVLNFESDRVVWAGFKDKEKLEAVAAAMARAEESH